MLSVLDDIYKKGLCIHPRTESFDEYVNYKENYCKHSPTSTSKRRTENEIDKIEFDIENKISNFMKNLQESKKKYHLNVDSKQRIMTYPPMNRRVQKSKLFTFSEI